MNAAPTDAYPTNAEASMAVMAVEVRYIKEAVERMERTNSVNVTRNEWEQRNQHVDARFTEIFKDMASRKMPWTSVAAFVVAGASLLVIVIPLIAN